MSDYSRRHRSYLRSSRTPSLNAMRSPMSLKRIVRSCRRARARTSSSESNLKTLAGSFAPYSRSLADNKTLRSRPTKSSSKMTPLNPPSTSRVSSPTTLSSSARFLNSKNRTRSSLRSFGSSVRGLNLRRGITRRFWSKSSARPSRRRTRRSSNSKSSSKVTSATARLRLMHTRRSATPFAVCSTASRRPQSYPTRQTVSTARLRSLPTWRRSLKRCKSSLRHTERRWAWTRAASARSRSLPRGKRASSTQR